MKFNRPVSVNNGNNSNNPNGSQATNVSQSLKLSQLSLLPSPSVGSVSYDAKSPSSVHHPVSASTSNIDSFSQALIIRTSKGAIKSSSYKATIYDDKTFLI